MSLGNRIAAHLPFLRRFARAVTGSQAAGDGAVIALLENVTAAPDGLGDAADLRVALYTAFHRLWTDNDAVAGIAGLAAGRSAEAIAGRRLQRLTPIPREALILSSVEGFSRADCAIILGVSEVEVEHMLGVALADMKQQLNGRILVIEDEPIIAMDLEQIVRDLGHDVVGIATTRGEAVTEALRCRPGLVLADIRLADDSSGIDAVRDILETIDVPVIFITAFPERLLTGDRPEPAFLITKPYQPAAVRAAISQALFFNPVTVAA
jgi:CheY-like chemotaxis protein